MAVRIEKVDLPGIGTRYDLVTEAGRRLAVITHRDGDRDIAIFDDYDPDASIDSIPLTDDEAAALADLLGTTLTVSRLSSLSNETSGLYTEEIELASDSPYAGRPLGETKARTRTHASIVAIARDGAVIPSPTPADVLQRNDVIVAVGTRIGLDQLGRLLTHGPD